MTSTHTEYPPLDLTFIREQLLHSSVGHTMHYHGTIPSTMPIAAQLAQDPDIPSGTIVVAEEQSEGRGRRGRSWQAPYASALLVSILLKAPHISPSPSTLTMQAGNALLAAVATLLPELKDDLRLKWPNDLVIGSDPFDARKVAGILAESKLNANGDVAHAVLGIGVNVNQSTNELPRIAPPTPRPISLRVAQERATAHDSIVDRSYLLVYLCQQLARELAQSPSQSFQIWKSHLATLGHGVAVYANGVEQPPTLLGQAVDLQEDGALIVEDENGERHTFHAADVSIRATSR